jgi:hypothetical protein
MKTIKRSFVAALMAALLLPVGVEAATGDAGAQFLKIGVGAKAIAMGEAFAGVADDPSAIYWNPAGLTRLGTAQFLAAQNFWLEDMSLQFLSGAFNTPFGHVGAAITYSSVGDIPGYDVNGIRTSDYKAYDAAVHLAYARTFVPTFSAGAALKIIQQKIEVEKAGGFALDIGALITLPSVTGLSLGGAIQNLGPGIKFIEESNPLPLTLKAGGAYAFKDFTLAADFNMPRDSEFRLNLGGQYVLKQMLALRAGFNTANSITAGLGVMWKKFAFDYAFVPYENLNSTHRIAVVFSM